MILVLQFDRCGNFKSGHGETHMLNFNSNGILYRYVYKTLNWVYSNILSSCVDIDSIKSALPFTVT